MKNIWQTQVAKAHFSRLLYRATNDGDQVITHRGKEVAVIISKKRYDELVRPSKSLIEFFLAAPLPDEDLVIERSQDLPRELDL